MIVKYHMDIDVRMLDDDVELGQAGGHQLLALLLREAADVSFALVQVEVPLQPPNRRS
jgi:hypothetical protein